MVVRAIEKDPERQLLEKLNDLFFSDLHQRCLYIRLSLAQDLRDDWKQLLLTELKKLFFDGDTEVYFCADGDLFAVNRSFSFRTVEQFITHLDQKLAPASVRGLADLFEVGADLSRLRKICSAKIENLVKPNNDMVVPENIKPTNVNIEEELSDLIKTISKRRNQRRSLEILVVEDDAFSQKLIQSTLAKYVHLTIVGDGASAFMNYVIAAPDMVFLDIGLPDVDGHSVLKRIFSIDPHAFVVMFSGKGDRDNIMKAVEMGAKGFVGKPFTREKLFQYIEKSPFVIEKMKEKVVPWKTL